MVVPSDHTTSDTSETETLDMIMIGWDL